MARSIRVLFAAASLAAAGCASPPDVGPFADSTVALRSAVRASGDALDATVRTSGLAGATNHADQLRRAWARRLAVMDESVEYADGLKSIVEAAGSGAETVDKVASGLQSIVNAAGIAMPAAGPVEVAVEGAGFVYRQVANAKAAKTLAESLEASDAAIREIATLLAADRKDVDELLALVESDAVSRIETADEHKEIPRELATVEAAAARITGRIEQATPEEVARLQALSARGDSLRARLARRDEAIAAVRERRRAQSDLVAAFGEAVSAWSAAHGQMIRAVRDHRPVTPDALVQATLEMRVLVRKVRAL